ncbi:hypothetical protein [Fluviicola taffensis]|uniref:hypothetical protein n=1 Tax=Fluviicola taffensis TaxID=191579 RepID=UPI003137E405
MTLSEIILNCIHYVDDEKIHIVFAKKTNGKFSPDSEAVVLLLTEEELENNDLQEIANSHCPRFDYFLEVFIIQDFLEDLKSLKEFDTDSKIVNRVIYYGEYDA